MLIEGSQMQRKTYCKRGCPQLGKTNQMEVSGRLSPVDTSQMEDTCQLKLLSTQEINEQNHKDVNMRVSLRQKTTNRRAHESALYCISMQLTLDYGERSKGMPKAPKAQTPHHCTGQRPCEQFSHSTQRVQGSPFTNRRQPAGKPQIPESVRR